MHGRDRVASLVKNRDAAELPTGPFGLVGIHLGVDGFEKGSHEGDFACGSHNASFVPDILDWRCLAVDGSDEVGTFADE